jgi:PAS domain S-box-containing protein
MVQAFIKNIPQPIFIYEKESLKFLDANDAALKLYGYSLDEFLQLDLTDLYTPEDIQTLLDPSKEMFKEGEFSKPFKHRKKDGNYVFVRISKSDYQFDDTDAFLNILEDASEVFELDKTKQVFKAAFENSNDMIFITDADGVITYVNESGSRNLGISNSDLINTSVTSLCGDEDKQFINNSVFHSHIKETVTFTIELKAANNSLIESEVVSTPVFDANNEVDSFVLIAKPVIESKPASSKKPAKEEKPGEKLPVQTTAQRESQPSLPDRTFLSGIFHEILTPMNVILGFTQEIIESIEKPTPEQKEASEIINQNRVSLLNLMNMIIEFSDIHFSRSEIEISDIKITDIIEEFDKSIKDITGVKDLEFAYGKISSSLKFSSDRKKFTNLLSNVFRLMSKLSQQKKLYFSAYSVENNMFNISVSDGFGRSSAPLIETMKMLFVEKKDPKSLGVPKLYTQMIITLLEALDGHFQVINEKSQKPDVAFRFPIKLSPKSEGAAKEKVEELVIREEEPEEIDLAGETQPRDLTVSEEIEIEESVPSREETVKPATREVEKAEEELIEEPAKVSVSTEPVSPDKKRKPAKIKDGLSSLSCLYIEDQVDSQILFKVQMKELKSIHFAASFEEAMPLLEAHDFDFIIMDINLQGEYNGLDALKIIHQMSGLENVPVIAVTAYVLPGDKEKFIATGFTDFISKPIFREKLLESLRKIFVN